MLVLLSLLFLSGCGGSYGGGGRGGGQSRDGGTPTGDSGPNEDGGPTDDGGPVRPCEPPDHDGDGVAAIACGGADCNDSDPSVHPGASDYAVTSELVQRWDGWTAAYAAIALDDVDAPHLAFLVQSASRIDGYTLEHATHDGA